MINVENRNRPELEQLFKKFHHQVSVSSVIEGNLRGKIYVDDLSEPRTGIMMSPEGAFIAGKPDNQAFNKQLSIYLEEIIQTGAPIRDTDDLWFYIDDPKWVNQFPQLFPSRTPFREDRLHFSCSLPAQDWGRCLPEGYKIIRADSALDVDSLRFPDDVWDWVKNDLDHYLERGFGAVLVLDDGVISWCTADCASGDRCEIGIITTAGERRKGFGALTVSAALDFCHRLGFREVGWHCSANNRGSIATAEKVGFKEKSKYYAWVCKNE